MKNEEDSTIFNSVNSLADSKTDFKSPGAFVSSIAKEEVTEQPRVSTIYQPTKTVRPQLQKVVKSAKAKMHFLAQNIRRITQKYYAKTRKHLLYQFKIFRAYKFRFQHYSKKYFTLPGVWVITSFAIFMFTAALIVVFPAKVRPDVYDKYSIYSSKPLQLDFSEYEIYTRDSRAQRINKIYKAYNCPLEGLGEILVYEADRNDIPWWIVAAISFQESSCGKNTPHADGQESYNAWGWAVYGDQVKTFNNWVRGVETVSEYLSDRFYSKGVTDTCEIMKTYTPPSKGSWCNGVNHFADEIINYKTPTSDE